MNEPKSAREVLEEVIDGEPTAVCVIWQMPDRSFQINVSQETTHPTLFAFREILRAYTKSTIKKWLRGL